MPKKGTWFQKLYDAVDEGRYAHFETVDGIIREGKLTGLRTREVRLNGKRVKMIDAFELNGDPGDTLSFNHLAKIDIEEPEEE